MQQNELPDPLPKKPGMLACAATLLDAALSPAPVVAVTT